MTKYYKMNLLFNFYLLLNFIFGAVSMQPTGQPTGQPTQPPSAHPSSQPTSQPTIPVAPANPICDLIAATDWGKYSSNVTNSWSCNITGSPNSQPCNNWTLTIDSFTYTPFVCDHVSDSNAITSLNLVGIGNGTIPSSIGKLNQLTKLRTQSSTLFSTIPSTVGDLSLLTYLYISNTDITGTFPSELLSIESLDSLTISSTSIGGSIPADISRWKNIRSIVLSGNSLSGTVPAALCELTSLSKLDITNNADLGCYSECLTDIEVFPHEFTLTDAAGNTHAFDVCDAVGSSNQFDFATVAFFAAVAVFCVMCFMGVMEKPKDNSFYAIQEAKEKRIRRRMFIVSLWNMCRYVACCLCIRSARVQSEEIDLANMSHPEEMKVCTHLENEVVESPMSEGSNYQKIAKDPRAVADSSVL